LKLQCQNLQLFCEIPIDTLIAILSSKACNISSEFQLWILLHAWLKANFKEREKHIIDLLPHIKLGLIPLSQYHSIVDDVKNLYCGVMPYREIALFEEIHRYQIWKQDTTNEIIKPSLSHQDMVKPRFPDIVALALGGWNNGRTSNFVELLHHKLNLWYKLPIALPKGLAYHGVTKQDNKLFIIGGTSNNARSVKWVFCLDLDTMKFSELPPLQIERCFVSSVLLGNYIYAIGGFDGIDRHNRLTSAEKFDISLNNWEKIADLNGQRSDFGAVAYGGKIYVLGGFDGNDYLSSVEVYCPIQNTWSIIQSMKTRRGGLEAVIFQDKLYAIGGCNDGESRLKSTEFLSLSEENSRWKYGPSMIIGRSNFGCCVLSDRIIVAAGYIHPSTTDYCEYFNGDQWYLGAKMNFSRSALALASIKTSQSILEMIESQVIDTLPVKRDKRILAIEFLNLYSNEEESETDHSNEQEVTIHDDAWEFRMNKRFAAMESIGSFDPDGLMFEPFNG